MNGRRLTQCDVDDAVVTSCRETASKYTGRNVRLKTSGQHIKFGRSGLRSYSLLERCWKQNAHRVRHSEEDSSRRDRSLHLHLLNLASGLHGTGPEVLRPRFRSYDEQVAATPVRTPRLLEGWMQMGQIMGVVRTWTEAALVPSTDYRLRMSLRSYRRKRAR